MESMLISRRENSSTESVEKTSILRHVILSHAEYSSNWFSSRHLRRIPLELFKAKKSIIYEGAPMLRDLKIIEQMHLSAIRICEVSPRSITGWSSLRARFTDFSFQPIKRRLSDRELLKIYSRDSTKLEHVQQHRVFVGDNVTRHSTAHVDHCHAHSIGFWQWWKCPQCIGLSSKNISVK